MSDPDLLWLKLDDGSGTTATDSSVAGDNGTLNSGVSWTTGVNGGAVTFNGASQSITLASAVNVTGGNTTLAVWLKPTTLDSALRAIATDSSWADGLYTHNAHLVVGFSGTEVGTLSTGTWQHVAVKTVSGTPEIFINGSSVGTSSGWAHNVNTIGNDQFNERYVGDMDDLRIYSSALTAGDIHALYINLPLLTGTITGSSDFGSNQPSAAFDGDLTTYYVSSSNGPVGIDLGAGNSSACAKISYAGRPSFSSRMVGGIFQGSNDNSNWTTIYTIVSDPGSGAYVDVTPTDTTTAYRYFRYGLGTNSFADVAEIQFFGPASTSTTTASLASSLFLVF